MVPHKHQERMKSSVTYIMRLSEGEQGRSKNDLREQGKKTGLEFYGGLRMGAG